jgi:hypothetical protein
LLSLREKFLGPYMAQSETAMDGELGTVRNYAFY